MADLIFDSALLSMCMTWRHDFGLMDRKKQMEVKRTLLGLYEHHVKPALARASRAESDLAAMRQRAEEAEAECDQWQRLYNDAAQCRDTAIRERTAFKARAERAEACLRSLEPFFDFSSIPSGAEGFVVQGDNPALVEAFAEAASILSSPPADASEMGGAAISKMENAELLQKVQQLEEALTPSAETKAAYIGEFTFNTEIMDFDGEPLTVKNYVPWTTTKEIMKAIRERALSPQRGGQEKEE